MSDRQTIAFTKNIDEEIVLSSILKVDKSSFFKDSKRFVLLTEKRIVIYKNETEFLKSHLKYEVSC